MKRLSEQPLPRDPDWPRYSDVPFPPYRYVPRLTPHPYRDPVGHSFGRGLPSVCGFSPQDWRSAPEYHLGIDYYNFAYWWEAHEILEEIWHKVGHQTQQGQFLQGLIQVAAGFLHRFAGRKKQFHRQVEKGLERLANVPDHYMGVDVLSFVDEVRATLVDQTDDYPLIELCF